MIVIRSVVGLLLLAHGLVHLLYLSSDTPEFSIERSWLLPEAVRRPTALVLMAATVFAFALVALAVWRVPGLSGVWPVLVIAASALSTVLLVVFWNSQLVFGLAINVALIAVVVTQPGWADRLTGQADGV
jgi:hypothetical protein